MNWRPHERSFTLAALATHLALLPRWGRAILDGDGYDLAESEGRTAPALASRAEVLQAFDGHVRDVRERLRTTVDAALGAPWCLRRNGRVVMSMPRCAALRRYLLDHAIHHRGQLTVYLRLQNVPLPPIYGPSADETP
jgi:uncharacterized damage-inducible protein DinB